MDDSLLFRAQVRGYITRPEILDAGYDDRDIRDARSLGLLTRIGPGLYALRAAYEPMTLEQKHAVRCRAVAARHGDGIVFSHHSAAVLHGLPVWGHDLVDVQVTRRDARRGRREAGVNHHVGRVSDDDIVQVGDLLVTKPARAIWEVACEGTVEQGLVTADAALHQRLISREAMDRVAGSFARWQGSRAARLTMRLADGRAESPGESRSRHLFWRSGIPVPDLQHPIYDRDGRLLARTDFAWELYRHIAEFDGRIKYDGTLGDEGFGTVFDEKQREDLIREQQWGLSRLVWADLAPDAARKTVVRLRHGLERSRSLYGRTVIV
jgi:hypothetical protein